MDVSKDGKTGCNARPVTRSVAVMLYDREDYAGRRAPESVMPSNGPRFLVVASTVSTGRVLWSRPARTLDEARALVPAEGTRFDRTGNWPSPMVPIEGWRFARAPSEPSGNPGEFGRRAGVA